MVGMKLLFPVSTVESPNMRMAGNDEEVFGSKELHGLVRSSSQIVWSDRVAMRQLTRVIADVLQILVFWYLTLLIGQCICRDWRIYVTVSSLWFLDGVFSQVI